MNVFIDTNILIDLLAKREPFYQNAVRIAAVNKQKRSRDLSRHSLLPTYFLFCVRIIPNKFADNF